MRLRASIALVNWTFDLGRPKSVASCQGARLACDQPWLGTCSQRRRRSSAHGNCHTDSLDVLKDFISGTDVMVLLKFAATGGSSWYLAAW